MKTGERVEVPESRDIDVYQALYADFCDEFDLLGR